MTGEARYPLGCQACKGAGTVEQTLVFAIGESVQKTVACPRCKGYGNGAGPILPAKPCRKHGRPLPKGGATLLERTPCPECWLEDDPDLPVRSRLLRGKVRGRVEKALAKIVESGVDTIVDDLDVTLRDDEWTPVFARPWVWMNEGPPPREWGISLAWCEAPRPLEGFHAQR